MYVLAIMVYDFVVKSEFRRGGVIHAISLLILRVHTSSFLQNHMRIILS